MADHPEIYTRVYSNSSAGLVARKSVGSAPLPQPVLLEEFRRHSDKDNRVPTALVSCSIRIIDTVQRAFQKHHKDGELAEDIWIAFIEIPSNVNDVKVHRAFRVAYKCNVQEPGSIADPTLFSYEVVVEHEIPEKYVVHKVSLQTLLDRGLPAEDFHQPSVKEASAHLATTYRSENPWSLGVALGCFARFFGARAPLVWLAWQLFYDCVQFVSRYDIIDGNHVWYENEFKLDYGGGYNKFVGISWFHWVRDGTEMSLIDRWLLTSEFQLAYDMFLDRVEEALYYPIDERLLENMAVSIGL